MPRFIIRRTGWNKACWKSKCFILCISCDFHFLCEGMDFVPDFPRYASVFAVVFPVLALPDVGRPIVDVVFPVDVIVGIYGREKVQSFPRVGMNRVMPDHGVTTVNRRSEPKPTEVLAIV